MKFIQLDLYPFLHKTSGMTVLHQVVENEVSIVEMVADILRTHTRYVEQHCSWFDDHTELYELIISIKEPPFLVYHTDVPRLCEKDFVGTKNHIWRQCVSKHAAHLDSTITDDEIEKSLLTETPIPHNGWDV